MLKRPKSSGTPILSQPANKRSRIARCIARTLVSAENLAGIYPAMSMLEKTSIKMPTLLDYVARLLIFIEVCKSHSLDWNCASQLDSTTVIVLDILFEMGFSGEDGNKLVSALKFAMPEVSRLGLSSLPRSMRAV